MRNQIPGHGISRRNLIKLVAASGASLALGSYGRVNSGNENTVFRPHAYLEISPEEGIERTVAWHLENKEFLKNVKL